MFRSIFWGTFLPGMKRAAAGLISLSPCACVRGVYIWACVAWLMFTWSSGGRVYLSGTGGGRVSFCYLHACTYERVGCGRASRV